MRDGASINQAALDGVAPGQNVAALERKAKTCVELAIT